MKDHGRAQETVVIGVVRPLVIGLSRLKLGCGRRAATRGAALWRSGQLPGVVGQRLLTYRYARLRGSAPQRLPFDQAAQELASGCKTLASGHLCADQAIRVNLCNNRLILSTNTPWRRRFDAEGLNNQRPIFAHFGAQRRARQRCISHSPKLSL